MRQHAIPQNILDIEFKLFTKFTVREFVYMAVGVGTGGIFLYFFTRGELPGLIAIPIFLISSGIGLFLGLVPINDQKADVFMKNYLLAITNPTRRVWRSKKGGDAQQEQEMLQATKGTMERARQEEKSGIIGAENIPNMNQFIEDAAIVSIEKEEEQRVQAITQEINQTQAVLPPVEVQQNISQPQKVETPTSRPLVVPRIKIEDLNYNIYKLDGSINPLNNLLVVDKNNTPLSNAVIGLKDSRNKIIIAQKTDEKGYTEIGKKLNPGTYTVICGYPKKIFPEYVIEIKEGIKSFKISEI